MYLRGPRILSSFIRFLRSLSCIFLIKSPNAPILSCFSSQYQNWLVNYPSLTPGNRGHHCVSQGSWKDITGYLPQRTEKAVCPTREGSLERILEPSLGQEGDRRTCVPQQRGSTSVKAPWGGSRASEKNYSHGEAVLRDGRATSLKDDGDLAKEHICGHRCGRRTRGPYLSALGGHSQTLRGRDVPGRTETEFPTTLSGWPR